MGRSGLGYGLTHLVISSQTIHTAGPPASMARDEIAALLAGGRPRLSVDLEPLDCGVDDVTVNTIVQGRGIILDHVASGSGAAG